MLDGLIVLDLTHFLAGPYATLLLADLGAEVIKIERPGMGDPTRNLSKIRPQGEDAYFLSVNRNKKSLTLDLTKEEGREVFRLLTKKADVVIENFSPEVMERLGLTYERLHSLNPGLIYCSLSGFGHTGPMRQKTAFDILIQAQAGTMSLTGEEDGPPLVMGVPMGDLAGGLFSALAILSALWERQRSGVGKRFDLSLFDCQLSLLTFLAQGYFFTHEVPKRRGVSHPEAFPYGAFETKDGFLALAAFQDKYFESLCQLLGRPEWAEDQRYSSVLARNINRASLKPLLDEVFREKTTDEWVKLLDEAHIPCGPVCDVDEALSSAQAKERKMVVDVLHQRLGSFKTLGSPIKPCRDPFTSPPALGEHTEEVLSLLGGLSRAEIGQLREKGVI